MHDSHDSHDDKPTATSKAAKRYGFFDNARFVIPDDFDTWGQQEIEEMFYGKPGRVEDGFAERDGVTRTPRWLRIVRLSCLSGGCALLCAGVGIGLNTARFLRHAAGTKGSVLANIAVRDADGEITYRPEFTFRTASNESVVVQSQTGTNPPAFQVGEPVKVFYDARQPSKAAIDEPVQLWFVPGVFLFNGTVALTVGFAIMVYERRGRAPSGKA